MSSAFGSEVPEADGVAEELEDALAEAEGDALAEAVGAALGLADALAPPSAVGSLPSVVSLVSLAAAASPSMAS